MKYSGAVGGTPYLVLKGDAEVLRRLNMHNTRYEFTEYNHDVEAKKKSNSYQVIQSKIRFSKWHNIWTVNHSKQCLP